MLLGLVILDCSGLKKKKVTLELILQLLVPWLFVGWGVYQFNKDLEINKSPRKGRLNGSVVP